MMTGKQKLLTSGVLAVGVATALIWPKPEKAAEQRQNLFDFPPVSAENVIKIKGLPKTVASLKYITQFQPHTMASSGTWTGNTSAEEIQFNIFSDAHQDLFGRRSDVPTTADELTDGISKVQSKLLEKSLCLSFLTINIEGQPFLGGALLDLSERIPNSKFGPIVKAMGLSDQLLNGVQIREVQETMFQPNIIDQIGMSCGRTLDLSTRVTPSFVVLLDPKQIALKAQESGQSYDKEYNKTLINELASTKFKSISTPELLKLKYSDPEMYAKVAEAYSDYFSIKITGATLAEIQGISTSKLPRYAESRAIALKILAHGTNENLAALGIKEYSEFLTRHGVPQTSL